LLKLLTGELAPDSGTIKLGTNLAMVTLDQRRAALDPNVSVRDTLTGGRGDNVFVGGNPRHVIAICAIFCLRRSKPARRCRRSPAASADGCC